MVALITGATSGIGKSYSTLLASKGWDLIITGRRDDIIIKHGKLLEERYKVRVEVVIVDFNSRESFNSFLDNYVKDSSREIGFLVNSVGFSNRCDFFNTDFDITHKMIEAHISRLSEITHYVVNSMKKYNRGGFVVNVSSLVGYLPSLHDPFYSGSKSFISTYSESISMILKPFNIVVQSLCPGFTKTDFHKDMNLAEDEFKNRGLKRWMSADDVVSYSYKKLKPGKVIVIPGIANKIIYYAVKILPKPLYYKIAGNNKTLTNRSLN
ncbi:SDR family NAD(P)-dependent oxidoreductase [Thiospirochaeta perfilievii]|uniref:SDR family NAD(P)-dependent oxidoreductase n=1 Tax=Thiospirochaeta perfilievii TaxID=252967 RepID=A0A5C1QDT5_9SPIO|nr:SDR family NAD(P)-dependent oxidoreductase [Thiospirochaeta perfilievii]QEN05528.1 SDR family NAD(P)-dependent oxidoreductase [Thiospirochaeta perfilievii]